MSEKKNMFALVGNWGFVPGHSKGLSVYNYEPETAGLELLETFREDVYVGQSWLDKECNMLYIVNEIGSRRGEIGGGGYVMALKVDPANGKITEINEKESLAPEPCYISVDKTKRYALVAHHSDHGHVTKITKNDDGSYASHTQFDDTALVLFRLNEDGSLGDACDVSIIPGEGASSSHPISHQHSVVSDPTGELFVVCDKGLDQIYSYGLDRAHGKLVFLQKTPVETGFSPRYSAFHPTLPILYVNNERKTIAFAYRYDIMSGKLERIGSAQLLQDEKAAEGIDRVEPSDILVHPNGKHLYVSVRGVNLIAVLDVDETGGMLLKQNISCEGAHPRGFCLSPDARYLFSANMISGNIATFAIGGDGGLTLVNKETKGVSPANMVIVETR